MLRHGGDQVLDLERPGLVAVRLRARLRARDGAARGEDPDRAASSQAAVAVRAASRERRDGSLFSSWALLAPVRRLVLRAPLAPRATAPFAVASRSAVARSCPSTARRRASATSRRSRADLRGTPRRSGSRATRAPTRAARRSRCRSAGPCRACARAPGRSPADRGAPRGTSMNSSPKCVPSPGLEIEVGVVAGAQRIVGRPGRPAPANSAAKRSRMISRQRVW